MTYIPLEQCEKGTVYLLHSRNLTVGVFDGKNGFIGIRSKFDDLFLFTEYHYDTGSPFGTVKPRQVLGRMRKGVELTIELCTVEQSTGRSVFYDKTPDENGRGTQDGGNDADGNRIIKKVRGWCYEDTKEMVPDVRQVYGVDNKMLFRRLKYWEKKARPLYVSIYQEDV